jgi:hypothetical protein
MLGHDPRYFEGSRGGLSGSGGGGRLTTSCCCWPPVSCCCCCCTKWWWCRPWGVTDNNLLSHKLRGRCVPRIPVIPALAGGSIVHVANHLGMLLSLTLLLLRLFCLFFFCLSLHLETHVQFNVSRLSRYCYSSTRSKGSRCYLTQAMPIYF